MSRFDVNNIPNKYFRESSYLNKFRGKNTFIQNKICSFHDYDNLYLVSKFYDGYILNYLKYNWNEEQIKFFSACLIQSLINLRKKHLIHRDIHFSNIVLDEKQYISLIDFHIVIDYKKKDNPKRNRFIGSPDLSAPEILKKLKYDYNSDYYRLGSMLYYLLYRKFPNVIRNNTNITDIQINYNETKNYSSDCIDFINKLIITDNKKRIGYNNIDELKNHNFLKNYNWDGLIKGDLKSPFCKIPRKSHLCNTKYIFEKKIFLSTELLRNDTFRNNLYNYDFQNNDVINKIVKYYSQKKN